MNHLITSTLFSKSFFYKANLYRSIKNKFRFDINVSVRDNSSYKHKYNSKIEKAINEQIGSELHAAINYLGMAVNFLHPSVSYTGAGGYFIKMYKEELQHMEVLIKYQLTRGGTPIICKEDKSEESAKTSITLMSAFNEALEMEKKITEKLENIVSKAEAVKDYQSADFITSKFLEEQMHSICELSHHVTVINRLGSNEYALYHYDKVLLNSYPYSLKP